jgi:hypothetical protein
VVEDKSRQGNDNAEAPNEIATVISTLESIDQAAFDALTQQFELIPALPRDESRVYDLATALAGLRFLNMSDSDAFRLLLLIADADWLAKLQHPIPRLAEQRLRILANAFGPTVDELLTVDSWPDDWRRLLVRSLKVTGRSSTEHRVRLQIHKYREDRLTLEMRPASFVRFISVLLRELESLSPDTRDEIEDQEWRDFDEQLAETSRKLNLAGGRSGSES